MLEFSEFKVLNHLDRVKEAVAGGMPPPVTLEVDPTNNCNHNCIWCIDAKHRREHNDFLPWELLRQALGDARELGVHSVVIKGGGEPLIYPWIEETLLEARRLGLDVGIITNGELLAERAEVIKRTCSWVRVSLDAGSAETHERCHRPKRSGAYDRVWQGVELLKGHVLCGIIYIIHPATFHEMAVAARRAKEHGCRYIGFKRVVAKEELFDAELYMNIDSNYVFARRHYQDESFEVMGFRIYNFSKGPAGRPYKLCKGHHLVGILCADGRMYACCSTRGSKEYELGSLHESRLPAIWLGERRRAVLAAIDRGTCRRICPGHTSYMRYDHYNELAEYLSLTDRPHAAFL